MLKIIIIEDELNVRAALKKMLIILDATIIVVAETGFVDQAIQLIKDHKPDLVFMDIELEDGTGFDILQQLKNINFKIIFTTAYNQHAIKAFKYAAVDYLLKPIDPDELQNALSRAKSTIENENEHQNLIEVLKNNRQEKEQKIVLKTTENRYIIKVNDIIRLEADGSYTIFVTLYKKLIISKNIKYYQDLLTNKFIRCHQSHLVNATHIKSMDKSGVLLLSNNDTVVVSTRKRGEIAQIIANINF